MREAWRRLLAAFAMALLPACAPLARPETTAVPRPATHRAPHDETGARLHCMGADGAWVLAVWSPEGRICAAPARFVEADLCAWEQRPAREPAEARVAAAAADDSLVGDVYNDVPICILPPPF